MKPKKLTLEQKKLRKRILEIIHQAHQSHIGSCLSVVDIIEAIYNFKKNKEKFVLSNGHAAVALYAVLEKHGFLKNPSIEQLNVHPIRDEKKRIDVSTGSLGQGLPIALGMAMANPKNNVYCLISDGECAEGSIWEALRITVDQKVNNLKIIVAFNGMGCYCSIPEETLKKRIKGFGFNVAEVNGHRPRDLAKALRKTIKKTGGPYFIFAKTTPEQLPFLKGIDAHYYVMSEPDFLLAMEILND